MISFGSRQRGWVGRAGHARRAILAGAAVLLLGALSASGSRADGDAPGRLTPPRPERLTLHWNNAADTLHTLRAEGSRPLRLAVDITGADTLQGYTVTVRGQSSGRGTAWKFADAGACAAATWTAAADRDSMAPAPWMHKLSITDLRRSDDGTISVLVSTAFDLAHLNPDSTYCLFHVDLVPPAAMADSVACPGWDGPAQFRVETAELLLLGRIVQVTDLGGGVQFEPAEVGSEPKPTAKGPGR